MSDTNKPVEGSFSESSRAHSREDTEPFHWEQLLGHARKRLEQRFKDLDAHSAVNTQAKTCREPRSPSSPLHSAEPTTAKPQSPKPNPAQRNQDRQKPTSKPRADDPTRVGPASQNAPLLDRDSGKTGSHTDEALAKGRTRGVAASLAAHALLLLVLGFVSFELPGPSAGMSFAAASDEPQQEILELEQPLNLPEPSEMAESQQVPTDMQLTEQFENLSASPLSPEALGEMSVEDSSSFSSASAIQSAASSTAASDAKFFGAAAGGNNFCYVVDGSGSMKGGPWIAARNELLKSLESLKPKQRFYIIIFSRSLQLIPDPDSRDDAKSALYATPENLAHARRWLMGVRIGNSGAAPKKAIQVAIEKEPDAIYLLTDGVTTVKDVAQTIRDANTVDDLLYGKQTRVPIHTIAYYSLKGQSLLREIAAQNQGQFIYVPDPNP